MVGDGFLHGLEEECDRELLEEAMARVRLRVQPHTWQAFTLTALDGQPGAVVAAQLGRGVAPTPWAELFHRRVIQDAELPTADLRKQRGGYYGRLRDWNRALTDFAAPGVDALPERAALLLQTGDGAGYQKLLADALAAPIPADINSLMLLSRAALQAPLPEADAQKALAVARRYQSVMPRHSPAFDALGFALLRTGQLKEAQAALETSLKGQGEPGLAAHSAIGLTLVHLQAGERELAKPYLKQADAWLAEQARQLPEPGIVASGHWDWLLWLEVRLLRDKTAARALTND